MRTILLALGSLAACAPGGTVRRPGFDTADTGGDTGMADTGDSQDTAATDTSDTGGPCAVDAALVDDTVCMDRYEAPNVAGADPLVMYTFDEAAAWCDARGRRLCYDDEWQDACEGAQGWAWPYGDTRVPGRCNDDKTWRTYDHTLLNGWPYGLPVSSVDSLAALLEFVRAQGSSAAAAADHVAALYQGVGGGTDTGCVGEAGVFDLTGNVEEWTRRRDGGQPQFHGKLKGRYWAEARTCQSGVTTHGDGFRFYEIGFRCCVDAAR